MYSYIYMGGRGWITRRCVCRPVLRILLQGQRVMLRNPLRQAPTLPPKAHLQAPQPLLHQPRKRMRAAARAPCAGAR